MLSYKELAALADALRDQRVLSVYITGREPDPAQRRRWRIDLRHAFDDIARWLEGSSHAEREDFARLRRQVMARLETFRGTVQSPGWAGFYTTAGEQYASALPVAMPTMAIWSTGPCLAPYIRALKETRPVIVTVADARKAKVFRYADGTAKLVETLRARVPTEPPAHMGRPARTGFHSGTRGETGTDMAQREMREGTSRMLSEAVEKVAALAGSDGWIVMGGIPTVAAAALERVRPELRARAMIAEIDVHSTLARVADAARQAASTMRTAMDLAGVEAVLRSAESDGRGATGSVEARRALEEGRARELYFTASFLENHAADAEAAIRMALTTGAAAAQVSGEAAERLDQVGGIAARLRYASSPVAVT